MTSYFARAWFLPIETGQSAPPLCSGHFACQPSCNRVADAATAAVNDRIPALGSEFDDASCSALFRRRLLRNQSRDAAADLAALAIVAEVGAVMPARPCA